MIPEEILHEQISEELFERDYTIYVTQSNSFVTVRRFTAAEDPAYDEDASKPHGSDKKEVFIMTFGEKIKEARKAAGLSQEQFAEKMSVSRSAIAKWESDKGMQHAMPDTAKQMRYIRSFGEKG